MTSSFLDRIFSSTCLVLGRMATPIAVRCISGISTSEMSSSLQLACLNAKLIWLCAQSRSFPGILASSFESSLLFRPLAEVERFRSGIRGRGSGLVFMVLCMAWVVQKPRLSQEGGEGVSELLQTPLRFIAVRNNVIYGPCYTPQHVSSNIMSSARIGARIWDAM
jgi:hypothetical protein